MKKHDYKNSLFFLLKAEQLYPSLENKINLAVIYFLKKENVMLNNILYIIKNNYQKSYIKMILDKDRNKILTKNIYDFFMINLEKY